MKHLIIYAHPNPESLNGQFKQIISEHLKDNGHEVEIRDLYQLDFDPVLSLEDVSGQMRGQLAEEVVVEQEYIRWADCVTFIYPIWWTGLPAIMKGYIDRVFSYGFAYRYDQGVQKGLLSGKQAIIINTHGKSHEEYMMMGMDKALLLTSDNGIYAYCGFEVKKHLFFGKADKADLNVVENWKAQIKRFSNREMSLWGFVTMLSVFIFNLYITLFLFIMCTFIMNKSIVMKTYYLYIGLAILGVVLLVRFLYLKNEKDKKELEKQMNEDYKKIQEIETNDKDMIN